MYNCCKVGPWGVRGLRGDDDKITRSQDQGQMEKPGPRRAACNIQTSSTEQMQAGKEEEEEKSQERLHTSSTGEMQKRRRGKGGRPIRAGFEQGTFYW